MHYSIQAYPDIQGDNDSLYVAFSNLLQHFGIKVDPLALDDMLADDKEIDWHAITQYPGITLSKVGQASTWPDSNASIIQLNYVGGGGQLKSLYCFVDSAVSNTIVDSTDGQVKGAIEYGQPVAWASYEFSSPVETTAVPTPTHTQAPVEVVAPPPEPLPNKPKKDDGRTYVVLKHESSIITISRKLGIPVQDLIEHNDLARPYELVAGQKIHLPMSMKDLTPQITYDLFMTVDQDENSPTYGRHIHTTKLFHLKHNSRKWSFSDHRSAKHITQDTGTFPKNKELYLAGIAYVPVQGETYAYAMDEMSLGDYLTTGKVKYNRGWAHSDLIEGAAPSPAKDEPPVPVLTHIETVMAQIEVPMKQEIAESETLPENKPTAWKGQYEAFPDGDRLYIIVPTVAGEDRILVHDLQDPTYRKFLPVGDRRVFSGMLWKDGNLYGRIKRNSNEEGYLCVARAAMKRYIPEEGFKTYEPVLDDPWNKSDQIIMKSSQVPKHEQRIISGLALAELTASRMKFYGRRLKDITKGKKQ